MKVITQYPVYVDKNLVGGEDYLSLDGKSSATEIKAFQNWVNNKLGKNALEVNGKWDGMDKPYATYGAEYEAYLKKKGKTPTPKGETTGLNAEAAAAQSKQGILDKMGEAFGITDDKAAETPDKKGMSKTVKYVLIGVGVLAVLGLGYALIKKK